MPSNEMDSVRERANPTELNLFFTLQYNYDLCVI